MAKFLAALILISVGHAVGTGTSGGGGAFVKRDATGHVEESLLIDIWESANIPFAWPSRTGTINIPDRRDKVEDIFGAWFTRLGQIDPAFAAQVQTDYIYINQHINRLPPGILIVLPPDLQVDYYPQGYPPEGMMRFHSENGQPGQLDVNQEIFDHLTSPLHTAGAWMHEAIYKTLRESTYAHTTSVMSRHLNACLLSTDADCLSPRALEFPKDRWHRHCQTATSDLWINPMSPVAPYYLKGFRIQFSRLGNALPSVVSQVAQVAISNPDGSYLLASSGAVDSAFATYNYSPATAVVEIALGVKGDIQSVILRSARSSLNGGLDLLPNGSEIANCEQEVQP
jgi:hypothetical protein